ncbi:hypothetical protein MDAP_002636 [Mitosporidium daphniae]|uniref:DnaJ-domain-containing protein n=1 Tax=Mitosporidium daphniae TaxID=1485682 RepID=A0A098VUF1_9MICR|nr:DnaJ-domain-containing protein [Mitosporidium daphniae]KGG52753.1 DnaJ-domain-containing protein [Mitosporidium daphniae]|eukprot:XP_013239189.1 DnaJ-domain-containing protein [Mitosporidium daphniae]
MLSNSKCYYEVLGTPRSSTIEEIRSSYKRKALQLHPDKNSHRLEEATHEFAHLQHCYSVLSDPHERKWYDQHREQILHASKTNTGYESQFLDTSDLMPYFSPGSAFKGFSDQANGFFTVYRDLFQKMEFFENQLLKKAQKSADRITITSFGDSNTPFIPSVKQFYDKWTHFNSVRSFSDQAYASYSTYENRGHRRYVEKEGKKETDQKKKEYITTIRSLALFIKKRDPRYQHWLKVESEKKLASKSAKAQKESKAPSAHKKQNDEILWRNTEEKDAYEAYFAMYAEEYLSENADSDSGASLAEEEEIHQCIACNKSFKSESQWNNHEKSKKHQKNAFQLKKKILKDEDRWKSYLKQTRSNVCEDEDEDVNLSETDAEALDDELNLSSDESSIDSKSTMGDGNNGYLSLEESESSFDYCFSLSDDNMAKAVESAEEAALEALDSLCISSDENEVSVWGKGQKPPKIKPKSTSAPQPCQKKTKNAKKKRDAEKSAAHICHTCRSSFPSRNSLFQHLKKSGHQAFK